MFMKMINCGDLSLIFKKKKKKKQPVSSVVGSAIGAGGHGFKSRVSQIRSAVANGSLPLRRFFGAVLYRR